LGIIKFFITGITLNKHRLSFLNIIHVLATS
jgi:hypothetical protein